MAQRSAFHDMDILDELEGWSPTKMAKTVAKMIAGADNIALALAEESGAEEINARLITQYASALKMLSGSIQYYTGIYTWAMQQGHTGQHAGDTFTRLMEGATSEELRIIETILARQERVGKL